MPSFNDMFPSKYLSAADLDKGGNLVTISSVESVTMKDPQTQRDVSKWLVIYNEFDKGMVLNVTNGKAISKIHGGDTDEWIGQQVIIYPTTTNFGGEVKDCIRVDEDATFKHMREAIKRAQAATRTAAKPAGKTAQPVTQAEADDDDEDLPF